MLRFALHFVGKIKRFCFVAAQIKNDLDASKLSSLWIEFCVQLFAFVSFRFHSGV